MGWPRSTLKPLAERPGDGGILPPPGQADGIWPGRGTPGWSSVPYSLEHARRIPLHRLVGRPRRSEDVLEVQTLEQLQAVDTIVQRFTPLGLSAGTQALTAQSAATFVQRMVATSDLAEDVPPEVRGNFDRIRRVHSYGALCYHLFTVASDQCFFVLDQALGARFITYYEGRIPLVVGGVERVVDADTFGALRALLFARGVERPKGGWLVASRVGKAPHKLSVNLRFLLTWAWDEGLLPGQRTRRIKDALANLRNYAAHWTGQHTVMPPDSARAIGQMAEIINRFWGHDTPGGSLFPAPLEREQLIVSWDESSRITSVHRPLHQVLRPEEASWQCVVVLGVPHDEGLMRYDARFERTVFPAEYLFGPCALSDAFEWVGEHHALGAAVTYLDRIFAVRSAGQEVDRVRRPEVMAGLSPRDRDGTWQVVRADHPVDAWSHATAVVRNAHACTLGNYCESGGVTPLALGSWEEAVACARNQLEGLIQARPPEARVPTIGFDWPV